MYHTYIYIFIDMYCEEVLRLFIPTIRFQYQLYHLLQCSRLETSSGEHFETSHYFKIMVYYILRRY